MSTITRWEPYRALSSLQHEVHRLFDDDFGRTSREASSIAAWMPAVDILENEKELVLKADLPDLDEKDIEVRTENNILTVSGERKYEKDVKEDNHLRVERAYGAFSRSFSLPNTVNCEAIKADYKNGVLTVRMPKREEARPKQVKVAVSGNGK
jgi:HSP20 family protein